MISIEDKILARIKRNGQSWAFTNRDFIDLAIRSTRDKSLYRLGKTLLRDIYDYPSSAMAKETLYAGTTHGHHEDKGTKSGLTFAPAQTVNVPLLADAVANFECRFVTEYRPGNCPLVVGKVVASHVNADESIKRLVNLGKGYQLGGL